MCAAKGKGKATRTILAHLKFSKILKGGSEPLLRCAKSGYLNHGHTPKFIPLMERPLGFRYYVSLFIIRHIEIIIMPLVVCPELAVQEKMVI